MRDKKFLKKTKKIVTKDYIFMHEKHRKNAKSWKVILAPITTVVTVPSNVNIL